MSLPLGPSTAFVSQFNDTIAMLAQQMDERLRPTVMVDSNFLGQNKFYDQYGTDTFSQIMSRYADTPLSVTNFGRRMVVPSFYVSATLEDPQDALATLVDVKSAFYQAKMFSAARQIDLVLIQAATGTALTGQTGTTSTTFTAGNIIADTFGTGTTPSGLNKAKMIRAKRILDANEVPAYDRTFVYQAGQLEDLLNTTEAASVDFNTVKSLVDGSLTRWLGFNLVHSEQLTQSGSDTQCIAYQKTGMMLAIQKNPEGRIDPRPDKNYAWQVYMSFALGATRMEETKVVQINCLNS